MKTIQTAIAYLALGLDRLSEKVAEVIPAFGLYVAYTPAKGWQLDAWKEEGAYRLKAGGLEVTLDRPRAR